MDGRKEQCWKIQLFGELSVHHSDGSTLNLNRTKDQAMHLLAYLAYHFPNWCSKEDLTRLLWNNTGSQYEEQLKPLVSRARKPFKGDTSSPSIIQTHKGSRRLNPSLVSVDVKEFKDLVAEGTTAGLTRAAEELYRGQLLQDHVEPWIDDERQKCDALYLQACQKLEKRRRKQSENLHHPFYVASHKFIPIYYGPSLVEHLASCPSIRETQCEWMKCQSIDLPKSWQDDHLPLYDSAIETSHGAPYSKIAAPEAMAYCLPFGTVVFHVREPLQFDSIAALATWRRETHRNQSHPNDV